MVIEPVTPDFTDRLSSHRTKGFFHLSSSGAAAVVQLTMSLCNGWLLGDNDLGIICSYPIYITIDARRSLSPRINAKGAEVWRRSQ
nr:hypothetical transcript [Hymenolepis microstoma]